MPIGKLLAITFIFALAFYIQLPSLSREKVKRDMKVYIVLMIAALLLSYACAIFPERLPSPNDPINKVFSELGRRLFE